MNDEETLSCLSSTFYSTNSRATIIHNHSGCQVDVTERRYGSLHGPVDPKLLLKFSLFDKSPNTVDKTIVRDNMT